MPALTPAKATVSAGLRAVSRSLSASGLAASATAAAMAGGTLWAEAGAQRRLVANRAALRGRIMAGNSCFGSAPDGGLVVGIGASHNARTISPDMSPHRLYPLRRKSRHAPRRGTRELN